MTGQEQMSPPPGRMAEVMGGWPGNSRTVSRPRPLPRTMEPLCIGAAGIRALTKTGQPITFRAVAAVAAGGGCRWTSFTATPTCGRIERLRGHQPAPAAQAPSRDHAASSVVATLTALLAELRRELTETKTQLAAAHGELLTLRRHPGHAAPGD
jgi:hypothetical protein